VECLPSKHKALSSDPSTIKTTTNAQNLKKKKLLRRINKTRHSLVAHTLWEAEIGRIEIQGQAWQTVMRPPSPIITRAKWNGGVAQATEYLLCKHEPLSSK
jgi:hypothetical protein